MHALEQDFAAGLLTAPTPPCLSLYQPTHRHFPERQQDPIRFRNLTRALAESLRRTGPAAQAQQLLEPFLALADDPDFWNRTLDGLAVLAAPGVFRVYRLQRRMPERAIVADSFHTKPLLRFLQSAERFHVLGLNRQSIRLFSGNRDALDEIEPAPGVPRTLTAALGDQRTEPHRTVASYGGVGGGAVAMHHGHGGREAEVDIDTERFFRAVDRAVHEHHSAPTALPLVLAALPEHHHLFRRVSRNPHLLVGGIDVHPDTLSPEELRTRAWKVIEPRFRAGIDELLEGYGAARARGLGGHDLAEVARSVAAGRVATLLIEADRTLPGEVDPQTGTVTTGELAHPGVDDVLDDLAALAMERGGRVVVLRRTAMPTDTGVAAIYRY